MKKLKYLLILCAAFNLFSCFGDESSVGIQGRIDSLENAINANDYDAFRDCFDEDAVNFDTYTVSDFNDLTDNGGTKYSFGTLLIAGDNVSCTATITGSGAGSAATTFVMVDRGGDFYILEWKENGILMFDKK